MSLLDYALSGLSGELENGQTRLLAALDDAAVALTPQALDSAKRHIEEHFVLAGLLEHFDDASFSSGAHLAGTSVLYRRENVAPAAEPIARSRCDRGNQESAIASIRTCTSTARGW